MRDAYVARKLRRSSTEQIFTDIYKHNRWGGTASLSGTGSGPDQTAVIARELPRLFRELRVITFLDVPCGDFNWMKMVNLDGIQYIGGDIVRSLVLKNEAAYGRAGISFVRIDLLADELPQVDLILCRDCLVHLSFDDVFRALHNMCKSRSRYLLTTTFVERTDNSDILTGDWRALNLSLPPLHLPPPLLLINEGCTESDGRYLDKSLGLWSIDEIAGAIVSPARIRP
jgi:SAM-dependent methyltransferase